MAGMADYQEIARLAARTDETGELARAIQRLIQALISSGALT